METKKIENPGFNWEIEILVFSIQHSKKRQATNHTTQLIKEDGEAASNIASIKSFAPTYYADLFSQSSY